MTQVKKLTIVSRRDLSAGYQATQAAHSLAQFIFEHPAEATQWFKDPYLAVLSVQNEEELNSLIAKLEKSKVKYSIFREPDINNQITAIAIEPSDQTRRLTSSIPKMLREYNLTGLIDKNSFQKEECFN